MSCRPWPAPLIGRLHGAWLPGRSRLSKMIEESRLCEGTAGTVAASTIINLVHTPGSTPLAVAAATTISIAGDASQISDHALPRADCHITITHITITLGLAWSVMPSS